MKQNKEYKIINIDTIKQQDNQIRQDIDQNALEDLKQSINKVGIISPITVAIEEDGYIIVAGHRRLEATKQLGLKTIPAMVMKGSEPELRATQLHENYGREEVSPVEEGTFFALLRGDGYTIQEVAIIAGVTEQFVRGRIALTFLNERVKEMLHDGIISIESAKLLTRVTDIEILHNMCDIIKQGGMSTNTIKNWVMQYEKDNNTTVEQITQIKYQPNPNGEGRKLFKCSVCKEKYLFQQVISSWICMSCAKQLQDIQNEA